MSISLEDPVADYLNGLPLKPGIDQSVASLERVFAVLERLGNPQESKTPVVHLAGTNGKGSTLANLRAMAEADGRRVHCLTSPHMVHTREQVRIAGKLISDTDLIACLKTVWTAAEDIPLTPFEHMTIAAFVAFSNTAADLILLETGLGGRLDATNVVRKPLLQVITPISFDHQEFLGNSLAQIAREKAGIMREGGICVSAPQTDVVRLELDKAATSIGSHFLMHGVDWRYRTSGDSLLLVDGDTGFAGPMPTLVGDHQIMNAATAIVAARAMGQYRIPDSAIKAGLGWVRWPGRLQDVSDSRLQSHVANRTQIWLDGGHNPSAADALARFLRAYDPVDLDITLICAMKSNKNCVAFFRQMQGLVNRVVAVPLWEDETGYAPADLAAEATALDINGLIAKDLRAALARTREETNGTQDDKKRLILIAGSLRLAGECLLLAGLEPR